VRVVPIVIDPPRFDLRLRFVDRRELVHVQALVAQTPSKSLNRGVFHGFPWTDEIQLDAAALGESS